ncbi:Hypothetical predicted protein [Octopus vulgaris]|uniref:Uncharacterized protein n=3 Tax=Octopus TaxID=6643 RepID=A0AA36EYR8_OCTVU|nr:UPF0184 protein [Octopus bimaculoides]XP_029658496.1 UPF0184 protein [Octopus sinensis]CAI9718087.1 Hypothetical predicted protein [Octopus vulgaris]|eukprot:XP_014784193.1 PREDICTED: UPF0184 protein-like [Octopus bimaculoides]
MSCGDGEPSDAEDTMKSPKNVEVVIDPEDIGDLDDIVDHCSQEYVSLNNTLDQLDTCLATLEEQSDGLYARLKDLLASTKDIRQELQMQNNSGNSSDQPEH